MNTTVDSEIKRRLKLAVSHIEQAIGTMRSKGEDMDQAAIENMKEAVQRIKTVLDNLA